MPLSLIKRIPTGSPLSAVQNDANMTAIENAVNTNETDITTLEGSVATITSTYAPKASPALTGTPTAPTASPGTNTTQIATTAFVTAAVGAIPTPSAFNSAPAKAVPSGSQTVDIDAAAHKLLFASEVFDPSSAYDAANSRYVAPATGYYQVFSELQLDNAGGTSAAMRIEMHVFVNGSAAQTFGMSIASPPNDQWFPQLSALVTANAGQFIEIYLSANDGVNSGDLTVGVQSAFSVNRISV